MSNYLIPGENSEPTGIAYSTGSPYNRAYFAGNFYNGKLPDNPWSLVDFDDSWTKEQIQAYKQKKPFETGPVMKEDATTAYKRILESGGASLPKRDAVDNRIVDEVKNRSGKIINSQEEVGGWPTLNQAPAHADKDRDGMPDDWEKINGLDPNNPEDRNKIADDGYTMLEIYLNNIK